MNTTQLSKTPHPRPQAQPRGHAADLPDEASLAGLEPGQSGQITGLRSGGRPGQRLADMGFCPGLRATVVRRAPLGDPLEVDLAGQVDVTTGTLIMTVDSWKSAD